MLNPYYDYEKLGLDIFEIEEILGYEFNKLVFFKMVKFSPSEVWYLTDSGCSCPTPFEDYCGETLKDIIPQMNQIRDYDYAEDVIKSWKANTSGVKVDYQKFKDWFYARNNQ